MKLIVKKHVSSVVQPVVKTYSITVETIDSVNRIATLAISEPSVKDAVEVTDANVTTAVTHLMSSAINYLI